MSSVRKKLIYGASLTLRQREFVKTGKSGELQREINLQLTTPEARADWVECFGLAEVGDAAAHKQDYNTINHSNLYNKLYQSFASDKVLSQESALALIAGWAAEIRAKNEKEKAESLAKEEAEAKNKREGDEARALLSPLYNAAKWNEILALPIPEGLGVAGKRQWDWYRGEAKEKINDASEKAEKEALLQSKRDWIAMHGSPHLKEACLVEGYDCKRLYLTERAAMEAPGFKLDLGSNHSFIRRSCPSPKALQVLKEARGFNIGEPVVKWSDEEEEVGEVVVIHDFQGNNTLYKVISE